MDIKKIGIIAGGIILVIMAGIFYISRQQNETDVTKNQTKVGVILNGSTSDNSWGQACYEGMEKCAAKLNLSVAYKENVVEDEGSLECMEQLIADGCEIIICNSFAYGKWELEAAKKYPEVYFFHATGVEERENMATYFGRIYQMRYLSGIVAGMQTATGKIGYVASFPISEVNRGINAFTLGVREVNPDALVYVEWSNSWVGDDENKKTAERLFDNHPDIDVMAMHMDSLTPLDVAQERKIWSIGYNKDNSALYPDTYLTAPVWQWENFFEARILECLQGKFKGIHYWEGIETGVVGLAPLTKNVKPGIEDAVSEYRKKLESGTFDVFYGPVRDKQGNIRVAEGENMSDDAMLNDFDWYVKGVVLSGEE